MDELYKEMHEKMARRISVENDNVFIDAIEARNNEIKEAWRCIDLIIKRLEVYDDLKTFKYRR